MKAAGSRGATGDCGGRPRRGRSRSRGRGVRGLCRSHRADQGEARRKLVRHGGGRSSRNAPRLAELGMGPAEVSHAVERTGVASGRRRSMRRRISPDGAHFATGGWDGKASIWNLATGEREHDLPQGQYVHCRGLRRHGRAIGRRQQRRDDRRLRRRRRQAAVAALPGTTDGVLTVRFSPDGKRLLTAGYDNMARLLGSRNRRRAPGARRAHLVGVGGGILVRRQRASSPPARTARRSCGNGPRGRRADAVLEPRHRVPPSTAARCTRRKFSPDDCASGHGGIRRSRAAVESGRGASRSTSMRRIKANAGSRRIRSASSSGTAGPCGRWRSRPTAKRSPAAPRTT